jgi:copper chaperone CopZ
MTCENCAIRVENALNGLPGTWASVSIADHTALVRTTAEPDLPALREAVAKAGYVLL